MHIPLEGHVQLPPRDPCMHACMHTCDEVAGYQPIATCMLNTVVQWMRCSWQFRQIAISIHTCTESLVYENP